MHKNVMLSAMALLIMLPVFLNAQEQKTEEVKYIPFYVIEDEVHPDMYFEYLDGIKGYMNYLKEHSFKYPVYTFRDENFNFYFNIPMGPNIAFVDSIHKEFNRIVSENKEGWDKMFGQFKGTYESSKVFLNYWSKALSYTPQPIHEKLNEYSYSEMLILYSKADNRSELSDMIKNWVDLYKKSNIEVGFDTYASYLGTEDRFIMVWRYKNKLDAANQSAKIEEIFAKTGENVELFKKTIKFINKVENSVLYYMPKFSYLPE